MSKDGRELEPSASIIDSQSVKTTEKGGLKVSTFINTLKDANATGGHNGVDYCWLVQLIFRDGAKLVLGKIKDSIKRV